MITLVHKLLLLGKLYLEKAMVSQKVKTIMHHTLAKESLRRQVQRSEVTNTIEEIMVLTAYADLKGGRSHVQ